MRIGDSVRVRFPCRMAKPGPRMTLSSAENGWNSVLFRTSFGESVVEASTSTVNVLCLQCFDAVGWAAGRASGL